MRPRKPKLINQPENTTEVVITYKLALVDSLGRGVEVAVDHSDLSKMKGNNPISNLLGAYEILLEEDKTLKNELGTPDKQVTEKLNAIKKVKAELLRPITCKHCGFEFGNNKNDTICPKCHGIN